LAPGADPRVGVRASALGLSKHGPHRWAFPPSQISIPP
jgi:hypothetical protein